MNTAIILPPTAASFHRVAGLPLIQRTVLSALRAQFDRIIVVGGAHTSQLRALLRTDIRTRGVEVSELIPPIDGTDVTVIPSDRVLTTATFLRIQETPLDGRPLVFSRGTCDGVALCRPELLVHLDAAALARADGESLWRVLEPHGAQRVSLDGAVCAPISDANSVAVAERALCAQIRTERAHDDGPLAHWIDRHISLALSRWVVRHTRLRPNHITMIGTSVGLLAAVLLGVGTYWTGVAGTLLFLCATIIDGCDGEVARLTFRESAFGKKFDIVTDNIVHVAIFVGMAAGLYRQNPGGHYAMLIGILLVGFTCAGATSYYLLEHRPGFATSGGPPVTFKGRLRQRLLAGMEALMNRDFAYLLIVLAVLGRLHWFFWAAAFGTYVFTIALVLTYRWRDAT